MAFRYSSKVTDGKLTIRNDYIQTEAGDFQKLTPTWVRKVYQKAQDLGDQESMEKLEKLILNVYVPGDNDKRARHVNWCLQDELNGKQASIV